jgi:hypothetical protein
LHCVVPGGGISPDGARWIACRKDSFFLPHLVLSHRFRKKFLWHLRQAFRKGALRFTGDLASLAQPDAFHALCDQAADIQWVVHIKPPFGGPRRVLKYLARYTHRVAISNQRLLSLDGGRVTFEWKDYAGNQTKTMMLHAVEFIRRFLLHVLPPGLVHIRHFGFLANRNRKKRLALCRSLLPASQMVTETSADTPGSRDSTTEELLSRRCPVCKTGRLILIQLLTAAACACLPVPMIADTS